MGYTPKYFKPYELVPLEVYKEYGSRSFSLIHDNILKGLDTVHDFYNIGFGAQSDEHGKIMYASVVVNNYQTGGPFSQRGFRTCSDPLAPHSMHFPQPEDGQCHAADFDVYIGKTIVPADKIRHDIQNHPEIFGEFFTRLEDGVNWCHGDNLKTGLSGIILFNKPKVE